MAEQIAISADPLSDATCKFTVDRPVWAEGSVYFGSREKAQGSPLAEKLFAIEGVVGVLVASNRVTVTRRGAGDWVPVARQIGAAIRAQLQSGEPGIGEAAKANTGSEAGIRAKVQGLFDAEINPALAGHGGFVELIDVRGNTVYLQLGGGCQGCGAADVTLKLGIERAIREQCPEVGEILDTTDHAAGENPYFTPSKK